MELPRSHSRVTSLPACKMMRNAKLCFALCTVAVIAYAQLETGNSQRSVYDCRVDNLPTAWSFVDPPGTIYAHHAQFGKLGQTSIDMRFRNGGVVPIQSLAFVVEYADANHRIIDRVPIVAGADAGVGERPPNVLSPANIWKSALGPSDSALITIVANGIRTGDCPVRAEVTFARLHLNDGTVQTLSSPGWQLDPIPMIIPPVSRTTKPLPVQPPASLLAKLRISARGDVVGVVPDEPADPNLVNWIRPFMEQNWKFHPGLLNGRPVDSELPVLFLIYSKGMTEFPDIKPVLEPITAIRFVWGRDLSARASTDDELEVMYGILPEGSRLGLSLDEFASTK